MTNLITYDEQIFENIKHTDEYGEEFWYLESYRLF